LEHAGDGDRALRTRMGHLHHPRSQLGTTLPQKYQCSSQKPLVLTQRRHQRSQSLTQQRQHHKKILRHQCSNMTAARWKKTRKPKSPRKASLSLISRRSAPRSPPVAPKLLNKRLQSESTMKRLDPKTCNRMLATLPYRSVKISPSTREYSARTMCTPMVQLLPQQLEVGGTARTINLSSRTTHQWMPTQLQPRSLKISASTRKKSTRRSAVNPRALRWHLEAWKSARATKRLDLKTNRRSMLWFRHHKSWTSGATTKPLDRTSVRSGRRRSTTVCLVTRCKRSVTFNVCGVCFLVAGRRRLSGVSRSVTRLRRWQRRLRKPRENGLTGSASASKRSA